MKPKRKKWKQRPEAVVRARIVGEVLRDARLAKGWTQEDLAAITKIERTQIGAYETGKAKNMWVGTACMLGLALGIQVEDFVDLLDDKGNA